MHVHSDVLTYMYKAYTIPEKKKSYDTKSELAVFISACIHCFLLQFCLALYLRVHVVCQTLVSRDFALHFTLRANTVLQALGSRDLAWHIDF